MHTATSSVYAVTILIMSICIACRNMKRIHLHRGTLNKLRSKYNVFLYTVSQLSSETFLI